MISQETLKAVNIGIVTNKQLQEALQYYVSLEVMLKAHGDKYHLVWRDVFDKLQMLQSFWCCRIANDKLLFDHRPFVEATLKDPINFDINGISNSF